MGRNNSCLNIKRKAHLGPCSLSTFVIIWGQILKISCKDSKISWIATFWRLLNLARRRLFQIFITCNIGQFIYNILITRFYSRSELLLTYSGQLGVEHFVGEWFKESKFWDLKLLLFAYKLTHEVLSNYGILSSFPLSGCLDWFRLFLHCDQIVKWTQRKSKSSNTCKVINHITKKQNNTKNNDGKYRKVNLIQFG